jgi:hypothetical protein
VLEGALSHLVLPSSWKRHPIHVRSSRFQLNALPLCYKLRVETSLFPVLVAMTALKTLAAFCRLKSAYALLPPATFSGPSSNIDIESWGS